MSKLLFPQCLCIFLMLALVAPTLHSAELVSSASNGSTEPGISTAPSLSADGRFVAFASTAALLPGDTNGKSDVYLKDRQTKGLVRISDERGGDQPVITADGTRIAFRALDLVPQVRIVDTEIAVAPRTVSFPFGGGRSFRTGSQPAISPDGQFVSFLMTPIPALNTDQSIQFSANDTFNAARIAGSFEITDSFQVANINRAVANRSANIFFIETTDALEAGDTNGRSDIYRISPGSANVTRVTASAGALSEGGEVRDPVLSANGQRLFFISERQLRSTDTDDRETIYLATGNFTTLTPISTDVRPLRFSRQATSNGDFLTFIGEVEGGGQRAFVVETATGLLTPVGPIIKGVMGPPVISANQKVISFPTSDSLLGSDQNGTPDIYIFPNPAVTDPIEPPQVNLTSPSDGLVVNEGSAVNLAANASQGGISIFKLLIKVDGAVQISGGTSVNQNVVLPPGTHRVRAVAINDANVAAASSEVTITVRPTAGTVGFLDLLNVKSATHPDLSTRFSGTFRIDNNSAVSRGELQVILAETPGPSTWEIFGDENLVPPRQPNLLGVVPLSGIAADSTADIPFSGSFSPPEVVGDAFQGVGWTITARLQELVSGVWVDRDMIKVIDILPRLDETTPGPNGGVPLLNTDPSANPFNPTVLDSITIQGPAKIAAGTKATYRATANFTTGSAPCTPKWRVIGGVGFARISTTGVLTSAVIPSPQTITIEATFGGKKATFSILSTPVLPKFSVRASKRFAVEGGASGEFRFNRAPVTSAPATVTYSVTGTAVPGVDYVALSGSVTIPANQATATIEVVPLNVAAFSGRRTVTISLNPSPTVRLAGGKTATVFIDDDEPFRDGQPDAIVQSATGQPVGELIYTDSSSVQQAFARTTKTKPRDFTIEFLNRSNFANPFVLFGGGEFLGFIATYRFNGDDVTEAVKAGTFETPTVQGGESVTIQLRIQPTADTPVGAQFRCPVRAVGNGFTDAVEAVVTRVK
jgi:Tol biopolymer transport system component